MKNGFEIPRSKCSLPIEDQLGIWPRFGTTIDDGQPNCT